MSRDPFRARLARELDRDDLPGEILVELAEVLGAVLRLDMVAADLVRRQVELDLIELAGFAEDCQRECVALIDQLRPYQPPAAAVRSLASIRAGILAKILSLGSAGTAKE